MERPRPDRRPLPSGRKGDFEVHLLRVGWPCRSFNFSMYAVVDEQNVLVRLPGWGVTKSAGSAIRADEQPVMNTLVFFRGKNGGRG